MKKPSLFPTLAVVICITALGIALRDNPNSDYPPPQVKTFWEQYGKTPLEELDAGIYFDKKINDKFLRLKQEIKERFGHDLAYEVTTKPSLYSPGCSASTETRSGVPTIIFHVGVIEAEYLKNVPQFTRPEATLKTSIVDLYIQAAQSLSNSKNDLLRGF